MKAKKMALVALGMTIALTGCGKENKKQAKYVPLPEYEKELYDTVDVVKGDMTPEFTMEIVAPKYERKSYKTLYENMEVDKVYVAVGDRVKKGDPLISFKAGEIGDEVEAYKKQLSEQNILLDHLNKLSGIDTNNDYSKQISQLKDSINVTNMYISELESRLESYNFKADGNGTVYSISDLVSYGFIEKICNNVISVSYGNDEFYGEIANDYDFKIGEHYTAYYGIAPFDMVLQSIEEKGTDSNGNTIKGLTFVGAEGVDFGYRERLSLVVSLDTLKDVVYVPNECIKYKGKQAFVYMLEEDGFRKVVEIECGPTILDNTVVTSGLQEGERVVID